MDPDFFTPKRGLHHPAAINVAMVQELFVSFPPQFQSVRPAPKTLTEGTQESTFLIEDNNRLAAHAGLVDGMPDVDVSLLILAKPMRIAPHHSFGRNKPVVDTLVRVRSGTHDWKPRA